MADFFGATASEGRSESSMVDSIMMPILHTAMNCAHDRVRSRDGVLQGLVEQSKFCDLAVMQLDACITCLQSAEDDRGFHRETTAYRNLVSDLTEIRDRLLGRLRETECAIADKDRELQRLRNWFRNQKSRKEEEKEHPKADLERDKGGCDSKSKSVQDCDQIGSEINSLKRTLDVAMCVMQSAISVTETRPFDQQFCWEMEREIMTTLFGGFVRDFQVRFGDESTDVRQNWSSSSLSALMDDLLSLRGELESLAASISKMESSSSLVKKKVKASKEELKDEAVNKVSLIIKAHESIINKNSEKSELRCMETNELQKSIHGLIKKLDSLTRLNFEKDAQELDIHDHGVKDAKISIEKNKIREKYTEELNLQEAISGEIQSTFLRSVVKDFQQNIQDHELMSLVKEVMYMDLLSETIKNEMNSFAEKMSDQWKHGMENCTSDSFLREELSKQVLKEALKCITSKVGDLVSQNKELKTICNSLIASEIANHQSAEAEEFRVQSVIENEVYQVSVVHTLKDMFSLLKRYEYCVFDGSFHDNIMIKDQHITVDAKGNNSLIELLDSLLCNVEEQKLLGSCSEDEKQDNEKLIIQDSEYEALMMEENNSEVEFESSCDKFRKDLRYEEESEISNDNGEDDRSLSLCLADSKGSYTNQLSGFGFTMRDFIQLTADFENVLHQKLDFNFNRVERLKSQLLQLVRLIAPIRKSESLYRQAFIRRCENLQKAETEVDILGDQVNSLLSLLERIYTIIEYHAPALQQCSAVLNVLTLIKKTVNGVTAS